MERHSEKEHICSFREQYFFLSNFYPAQVEYDGVIYQSSEAAYQAQKCADKSDRLQFAGLDPSASKHLGNSILLCKDWEAVKVRVMKEIVTAKFMQNPELRELLLSTGDAYLEEGNDWGDRIWGTVDGVGQNLLGQILMQVRKECKGI